MTKGLQSSQIIHGCMRIGSLPISQASTLIRTALDVGINFFDHADIYGKGQAEEVFGKAVKTTNISRDKLIVQTKCGIRPGLYDFSKKHILASVDASLKRLQMDYIDVLLLHRPDTLMEPEEVAEAFTRLETSGKVRAFGVSNQSPLQMELLSKSLDQALLFNQLQFSLVHTGMVDGGLNVNLQNNSAINRDGGVLEYCRLKDITIQAWSPLQHGFIEGVFLNNPQFAVLNEELATMAASKGVSSAALAIAWILRHPAQMQPIVGTTNPQRLQDISTATTVQLSREEWYQLYRAAGNKLP